MQAHTAAEHGGLAGMETSPYLRVRRTTHLQPGLGGKTLRS